MYTVPTLHTILEELDANPNGAIVMGGEVLEDDFGQECHYKWIPWWKKEGIYSFIIVQNSSYKSLLNYQLV